MRQRNDGLRKRCGCARRVWAQCPHPWHFNFKWAGEHFRFTLERKVGRLARVAKGGHVVWARDGKSLGDPITSKTDAEREADRLRTGIRDGSLLAGGETRPQRETLTLAQLFETYRKQYIAVQRPGTVKNTAYQIALIVRTELERADGARRPFGDWLVADIGSGAVEDFQRIRLARGTTAANRDLALLRSLFSWAVRRDIVERTPFKKSGETVIKLSQEHKRYRRLRPGEADALLAACGPQLRAIVEAAIETGCRRGELLSLQWHQVRFEPKPELFLPGQKTKTKRDRTVPISTRLRALLEMRRTGPDGEPHQPDAYVFGNEVGERVGDIKRAWERAVLKAHGATPQYVVRLVDERRQRTGALAAACRATLRAIDLHFHDLRREAGSRWLDHGVPLHRIQKWLGHANISQTSTYLMAESADDDDAMKRFEARRADVQRSATDSETGHQNEGQPGTIGEADPQLSSAKHHRAH
jgi:integrase